MNKALTDRIPLKYAMQEGMMEIILQPSKDMMAFACQKNMHIKGFVSTDGEVILQYTCNGHVEHVPLKDVLDLCHTCDDTHDVHELGNYLAEIRNYNTNLFNNYTLPSIRYGWWDRLMLKFRKKP